jgi:putative redox protein
MVTIKLARKSGDFGFEAVDANGKSVLTDGNHNGEKSGSSPMQLLLIGLGGCSGIDIVSILKKQRQTVDAFDMIITGEREPGVEPSLWQTVHVQFTLKGEIDIEKAKKACTLSIDKYCSVAETLRRAGCRITWDVTVD